MAKPSFARLKLELDDACESLRGFTLGHPGSRLRDGLAGMQRVTDLCDRLNKLYASGPYAGKAASAVVSGRARIAAAKARLALLLSARARKGVHR